MSTETFDVFRASASLRKMQFQHHLDCSIADHSNTVSVYAKASRVFYVYSAGVLRGYCKATASVPDQESAILDSEELTPLNDESRSTHAEQALAEMSLCCTDEADTADVIHKLITVAVSESTKSDWSSSASMFGASPAVPDEYSMVIGLKNGGAELLVWIFKMAPTPVESSRDRLQLFRKAAICVPRTRLLSICSVPSLEQYELAFAAIDADLRLSVWTFADCDDPRELRALHTVDVSKLIGKAAVENKDQEAMTFHTATQDITFKELTISMCGRAAVLVGGDDKAHAPTTTEASTICVLSIIDTSIEGVVSIPHKQFGDIVSLEWTPPVTPERDCELLFMTSTSIGIVKFDSAKHDDRWYISWTSSRFDVKLQGVAALSNYPVTWISVGPTFVRINLHDLDGTVPILASFNPVAPRVQPDSGYNSKQLPVYHPIMLVYLLARGSFKTLETVLKDVKDQITQHEQNCYLRMTDDSQLLSLAPLELVKLLGSSSDTEERSAIYLSGKSKRGSAPGETGAAIAPARASDLFSSDFGAYRRPMYSAASSGEGNDRADMIFGPRTTNVATTKNDDAQAPREQSMIETDAFSKFFKDHKDSLPFLSGADPQIFVDIVAGVTKIVQWERDDSRKKDEAALRFSASLLWPYDNVSMQSDSTKTPSTGAAASVIAVEPSEENVEGGDKSDIVRGGVYSEQIAWAAVSDFQSELLQEYFPDGKVTWQKMLELRLPFWLRSATQLVSYTEKVAQAEYSATRDPFSVALFYVLLGKTKLLASLFKMAGEARISDLLGNNFADLRWKNAAIKNAYVLKTKQRYSLCAAFFLLGGKVQEAIAVAEHEDRSLVLPFLIARIYEKWDFVGQSGSGDEYGAGAGFSQASFTGLSTSLRGVGGISLDSNDEPSNHVHVSADFLKTTVLTKAEQHNDIYTQFLVKYLTGETALAIECLLSLPRGDIRCAFNEDGTNREPTLYWRAFGQTLHGASELVRFLRKSISPMKVSTKEKAVKLNAVVLGRLQGVGLAFAGLVHQRDMSGFFQEFLKGSPSSPVGAEFLSCRLHILTSVVGNQVDYIYSNFLKTVRKQMLSSPVVGTTPDFEDHVDSTIACAVTRTGKYDVTGRPETHDEAVAAVLRKATVDSLKYGGRLAALDFLVSRWNKVAIASGLPPHYYSSPVPGLIELITEGISIVGSGDIVTSATNQLHTKRVDQVCAELLSVAWRLLVWLFLYQSRSPEERALMATSEYVQVAVAAIYSAICVCSRYVRCPTCAYRICGVIFPHKTPLSKKTADRLRGISSADVCVYCNSYRRPRSQSVFKLPSLDDDIPSMFQVVQMLQRELENFSADVKTNRLQLTSSQSSATFSYCPYWTMLLVASCKGMPQHMMKVAGIDGSTTPRSHGGSAALKLVDAWTVYNGKLSKFAVKHLLCELAGLYFSPFDVSGLAGGGGGAASSSSISSPIHRSKSSELISPGANAMESSTPPRSPNPSNAASSPHRKDNNATRQLLKCACDDCPWLLVLNLFYEKDELLLRLSGQFDVCSEKINGEIKWGRLPQIPSRKAPLTRSQKILLASAAGNSTSGSRVSDISELLQKRGNAPLSASVAVRAVYRSETNIKGICFNRASDTTELSFCSSKGICRTASVDYSDGSKLQFKGMYGVPQSVFFPDTAPTLSHRKGRGEMVGQLVHSKTAEDVMPPVPVRLTGSPGSLLSPSTVGADGKSSSFKPTTIESHPFLPLFVSGNQKGQVHLWSFDSLSSLCAFRAQDVVAVSVDVYAWSSDVH